MYIAPIVEGHGEVEALAPLLHRIARAHNYPGNLIVNPPIRVKSGSFINDAVYRKKNLKLASAKAAAQAGAVLVILDCEDYCPAELGPQLLADANYVREDVTTVVCLADREYESWFIASCESLRGVEGLPRDLSPPENAQNIRGAKEWLGRRMNVQYDPIIHQAQFSRLIDINIARGNLSFDRLFTKLGTLLQAAPANRIEMTADGR